MLTSPAHFDTMTVDVILKGLSLVVSAFGFAVCIQGRSYICYSQAKESLNVLVILLDAGLVEKRYQ